MEEEEGGEEEEKVVIRKWREQDFQTLEGGLKLVLEPGGSLVVLDSVP